jgi:hypothetical protein
VIYLGVLDRFRNVWNAFRSNQENYQEIVYDLGPASYGYKPDRPYYRISNERSLITSIYTRIAIDVAAFRLRHVKVDKRGRYVEDVDSKLNMCLEIEPNLDQGPRAFRQDIVMTLFDKGCAAIVPVDTTSNPALDNTYDILTMRVGEVMSWHPHHVKVSLYNEETAKREEILLRKEQVAIVENPLYLVMNGPNSTMQRLMRKLSLLDNIDETSAGRLDLIIQLPYTIKSEARRQQAENRREEIEFQLKSSQYGIAYSDATEKITQLNRPVDNQLLKQVEYLTGLLYSQLGITDTVMNGTADEATMLNYYNRTIEPILEAIREGMQRSFIGPIKTRKGEQIRYLRNPFKLAPITVIAEVADKFSRNEILSPNEIRDYMEIPPSEDPKAELLMNSNMPQPNPVEGMVEGSTEESADLAQTALDTIDQELDKAFEGLGVSLNGNG